MRVGRQNFQCIARFVMPESTFGSPNQMCDMRKINPWTEINSTLIDVKLTQEESNTRAILNYYFNNYFHSSNSIFFSSKIYIDHFSRFIFDKRE